MWKICYAHHQPGASQGSGGKQGGWGWLQEEELRITLIKMHKLAQMSPVVSSGTLPFPLSVMTV